AARRVRRIEARPRPAHGERLDRAAGGGRGQEGSRRSCPHLRCGGGDGGAPAPEARDDPGQPPLTARALEPAPWKQSRGGSSFFVRPVRSEIWSTISAFVISPS